MKFQPIKTKDFFHDRACGKNYDQFTRVSLSLRVHAEKKMTELVEKDGILVLTSKDGTTRIMTNYVPRVVAIVKSEEIIEGVLVEHAPKDTNDNLKW